MWASVKVPTDSVTTTQLDNLCCSKTDIIVMFVVTKIVKKSKDNESKHIQKQM